ncbi:MAG: class I SAM-dependent methyltransferase [Verrucomicrobiota bacterium]
MSDKDAARHYLGEDGHNYHYSKRALPENAVPWLARLRWQKISPYVQSSDAVFEFGVGSGWNLRDLRCAARAGLDVSSFLQGVVEKHGITFFTDVSKIEPASFDVVLCHHTLEHLIDPAKSLQQMKGMLKTAGRLLLFVPFEKERRYRRFDRAEPNHHLYSWNLQTLGNLVEESGFKVIEGKVSRFGYERFSGSFALRWKLGEKGFRFIHSALLLLRPAFEIKIVAVKQ